MVVPLKVNGSLTIFEQSSAKVASLLCTLQPQPARIKCNVFVHASDKTQALWANIEMVERHGANVTVQSIVNMTI